MPTSSPDSSPAPSPSPGSERRRHPRAQADWPLELKLGAVPIQARLRDVSRSGLCFFLERAVPEMTLLGLEVAVPAEYATQGGKGKGSAPHRIRTRGVVVRCEKISETLEHYEVAVFFHQIDEGDAAALDELVRQHAACD